MYLSLSQAAKQTGKSKSTISNALQTGKLSHSGKEGNSYKIDPAELFRVFPKNEQKNAKKERSETPRTNIETQHKINMLELQLNALQEKVIGLEEDKEDYKNRLDREAEERQKLVLMLPQYQEKKGFFARLMGK